MFEILCEWFGQPLTVPVIVADLFFLAIGLEIALKVKNKKTIIYIMLTSIVLYFAAVLIGNGTDYMFAIISVFVGALAVLVLAGAAIGLLIKKLKRTGE